MTLKPVKSITKPGEGTSRQKYMSHEVYLDERYKVSVGLKGHKRLDKEKYEDYVLRRNAENGLLKEYLRGVFMKDGKSTKLDG